jgi:hypothetical protein
VAVSHDPAWAGRLGRTLGELAEDAETLQRAAAVLDDAVGEMRIDAPRETLRSSAAQVQSGAVALCLTLLAVVAQAERILALTGAEREPEAPLEHEAVRDALRTLRSDPEEALLEWQEFAHAVEEVLRHARALSSVLAELHADVVALASGEGDRNRADALRSLDHGSGRAHSSSEHIVEALRQICQALASFHTGRGGRSRASPSTPQ